MNLSIEEKRVVVYALRVTVAQFVGKDEIGEEYWAEEKKLQASTKRLLRKMETALGIIKENIVIYTGYARI